MWNVNSGTEEYAKCKQISKQDTGWFWYLLHFPREYQSSFFLQIRSLKWINGGYQQSQLFIHPSMVFTILRSNYAVNFQFVDKLKFLNMPCSCDRIRLKPNSSKRKHLFFSSVLLLHKRIQIPTSIQVCLKLWATFLYYKVHGTQTNVCKFVSPFMKFLYTNVSSWIFMPYLYAIMAHYHV